MWQESLTQERLGERRSTDIHGKGVSEKGGWNGMATTATALATAWEPQMTI